MYNSFYGWYLKCQSDTQTLAVIPAIHKTGNKRTCSIQVITDNDAWTVICLSLKQTGRPLNLNIIVEDTLDIK